MHVLYPGGMEFGDFFFGGQNKQRVWRKTLGEARSNNLDSNNIG